jgi:hypothetical protein
MFVTLSEAKGPSRGIPMRIHTAVTMALLVAAPLHAQVAPSAPAASQKPSSPDSLFNRGLTAFFANDLVTALPLLRRASTAVPEDPERLLWLAETARRLEAFEEADSTIRAAMSLLPCSSFAHTVLATLYSPQYSNWSGVSDDTAWIHLRAAVRCDESDGNAWVPLWIEAQRHEDDSLADRALVQLTRTGFLSGPYLTLARWPPFPRMRCSSPLATLIPTRRLPSSLSNRSAPMWRSSTCHCSTCPGTPLGSVRRRPCHFP